MKGQEEKMSRYFVQDTPLATMERMMMEVPRPEKCRGYANQDPAHRQKTQNLKDIQIGSDNIGTDARAMIISRYNSG